MKRKTIFFIAIIISLFYMIGNTGVHATPVTEDSDIQKVNEGDLMDGNYSFCLRWGKNSSVDFWCESGAMPKRIKLDEPGRRYYVDVILPEDDSLSGKIGCWINDAGVYDGQRVDVKCTYTWTPYYYQKAPADEKIHMLPFIGVGRDVNKGIIGQYFSGREYTVKYELFTNDGAGNRSPLTVNMGLSFGDIDQDQYYIIKLGGSASFNNFYALKNSTVQYCDYTNTEERAFYDNGFTESNDGLESMVRAEINNVHEFSILYGFKLDHSNYPFLNEDAHDLDYLLDKRKWRYDQEEGMRKVPDGGTGSYANIFGWGYFDATGFGPYSQPAPTKRVDKTSAKKGDNITYRVTQDVPQQGSKYFYNTFKFEDTLPDCLTIQQAGIKVLDTNNEDVSNKFNINVSGNKVTIDAKSSYLNNEEFYGNTYIFVVPAKINENLDGYRNGDGYRFKNKGKVTIDGTSIDNSSRETNEVTTDVTENKYRIDTSIDHGTITPNITGIPEGEDRSVTFTPAPGWHVSKVEVDGKDVYEESYRNGATVDFNDIVKDHVVNVTTERDEGKVTVKHITKNSRKDLTSPRTQTGYVNDTYTTSEEHFEGYRLYQRPSNATGTITESETTVTYVYELILQDVNIDKTIEATDSTNIQDLSGARFRVNATSFPSLVQLENPDTTYYSTVTDSSGNCVIKNLPFGNYNVVEDTVPDVAYAGKFKLNSNGNIVDNFSVTINSEKNYSYSIEDVAKKMQIKIYKEDIETGTTTQGDAHLEGAVYGLYRDSACTDEVERITTQKQSDGTYSATSGWYLVGTYYVKEITPPEGYRPPNDDQTFIFTIDEDSPDEQHFIVLDGKMINVDTSDINVAGIVVITFMSAIGVMYIVNRKKVKRT